MDLEKIKTTIGDIRHHRSNWDKIPALTHDMKYSYLDWSYNDEEIHVKALYGNSELIIAIKQVIQMYLEEE